MKFPILVVFATLPLARAQDGASMPEAPIAEAPVTAKPLVPKPALPKPEALRLAGFPVEVLKFEPALAAAFELTPEQQEQLQKTWNETVEASKKDAVGSDDKKQAQAIMQKARKDFESFRSGMLTDRQVSLIESIRGVIKSAHARVKADKSAPSTFKQIFLAEMKMALNADQLALVQAAGGKLP